MARFDPERIERMVFFLECVGLYSNHVTFKNACREEKDGGGRRTTTTSVESGAKHSFSLLTLTLTVGRANMAPEAFDILGCGSDLAHAGPSSIRIRSRNP